MAIMPSVAVIELEMMVLRDPALAAAATPAAAEDPLLAEEAGAEACADSVVVDVATAAETAAEDDATAGVLPSETG